MAGRPQLRIGTHGAIKSTEQADGSWVARCRYRDHDGVTRPVQRSGRSKSAAEGELQEALRQRGRAAGTAEDIGPESRLREVGAQWFEQLAAEVAEGVKAESTLGQYRSAWDRHVLPALGELRLREITVSRLGRWQQAIRTHHGPSMARTARTVLSGVLQLAVTYEALTFNPCRHMPSIKAGRRKPAHALTRAEVTELLTAMRADEKLVRWDWPDLAVLMLATGCRIGEALALSWDDLDLDAGTVAIRWHLSRVTGKGLRREPGAKSAAGTRTVAVPRWCTAMLLDRRVDMLGPAVFPSVAAGAWRDPNNTMKVLRKWRDRVEYGPFTSHTLRKTTLTLLDQAGHSPRALADLAGHSDPSMTMSVYMGRNRVSTAAADSLADLF